MSSDLKKFRDAAERGKLDTVSEILQANPDVLRQDITDNYVRIKKGTALMRAVKNKRLGVVEKLAPLYENSIHGRVRGSMICAGLPNKFINTALSLAAGNNFTDIVKALLDAGVGPSYQDEHLLAKAIENNNFPMYLLLENAGAPTEIWKSMDSWDFRDSIFVTAAVKYFGKLDNDFYQYLVAKEVDATISHFFYSERADNMNFDELFAKASKFTRDDKMTGLRQYKIALQEFARYFKPFDGELTFEPQYNWAKFSQNFIKQRFQQRRDALQSAFEKAFYLGDSGDAEAPVGFLMPLLLVERLESLNQHKSEQNKQLLPPKRYSADNLAFMQEFGITPVDACKNFEKRQQQAAKRIGLGRVNDFIHSHPGVTNKNKILSHPRPVFIHSCPALKKKRRNSRTAYGVGICCLFFVPRCSLLGNKRH